jgi:hypothetical protein
LDGKTINVWLILKGNLMMVLWLIKLYWIWLILSLIILAKSILSMSIFGIVIGLVIGLVGVVAKKAMASESFRNRIDRNL